MFCLVVIVVQCLSPHHRRLSSRDGLFRGCKWHGFCFIFIRFLLLPFQSWEAAQSSGGLLCRAGAIDRCSKGRNTIRMTNGSVRHSDQPANTVCLTYRISLYGIHYRTRDIIQINGILTMHSCCHAKQISDLLTLTDSHAFIHSYACIYFNTVQDSHVYENSPPSQTKAHSLHEMASDHNFIHQRLKKLCKIANLTFTDCNYKWF